jgi:hypothetical protein
MAVIFELFTRPAFMKLLDAGQDWSVKREEFRSALQQRVVKTLMIPCPEAVEEVGCHDPSQKTVKPVMTHFFYMDKKDPTKG